MEVRTLKHGNSLGFNLPSSVVKSAGIVENQTFELNVREDGSFLLLPVSKRVRRKSKYTVEALLEGIPQDGLRYDDISLELELLGKESEWL